MAVVQYLMVTKDGNSPVSSVIREYQVRLVALRIGPLRQLLLEGPRGVVGTENLGSQPGHQPSQILIHLLGVQPVKQVIRAVLVLHEDLEVLEYSLVHCHPILVPDGILTQEVKLHHTLLVLVCLVEL